MNSAERKEARYKRRKAKRDEAKLIRSLSCGEFEDVFSFRHLYLAGKNCCKGVYWKNSTQRYIGNIIMNTASIRQDLLLDKFKHRGFHEFDIMERGKKRHIRAVHITERVVQKALCDYCLVPIFGPAFVYDNSASLKKKGMDFALRRVVRHLQKHIRKYGLQGGVFVYDFHSYFDLAPHEPLFREAKRRIHSPKLRKLGNSFIKDFGNRGLGLGSQVSQTNALLLPNPIDHLFKEELRIKGYERYMDDGIAIHQNIEYLKYCEKQFYKKCKEIGLEPNMKKTKTIPLKDFFKFLKVKFIITDTGKVILKMNKDSTKIIRRKLRSFKRNGLPLEDVRSSYASYQGHMKRGNSFKIIRKTNKYFQSIFGFYPDKKGWDKHCIK